MQLRGSALLLLAAALGLGTRVRLLRWTLLALASGVTSQHVPAGQATTAAVSNIQICRCWLLLYAAAQLLCYAMPCMMVAGVEAHEVFLIVTHASSLHLRRCEHTT
jgi:hypothetical protein